MGEKAIHKTGIDEKVTEAGDRLADVIGKRNVDKLGDIAMTSFGYSDSETCICCPCLPASQILLFITVPFFGFNLYKLGLGVSYDSGCSNDFNQRLKVTSLIKVTLIESFTLSDFSEMCDNFILVTLMLMLMPIQAVIPPATHVSLGITTW